MQELATSGSTPVPFCSFQELSSRVEEVCFHWLHPFRVCDFYSELVGFVSPHSSEILTGTQIPFVASSLASSHCIVFPFPPPRSFFFADCVPLSCTTLCVNSILFFTFRNCSPFQTQW